MPTIIVNHERPPGIGPLAGWRGGRRARWAGASPIPTSSSATSSNGCFWRHELAPTSQRYYKHANRAYLDCAVHMGFLAKAEPIVLQLYSASRCSVPPRRARPRHRAAAAEQHRARIATYFDPLPFWYPPFEDAARRATEFPLHAITQRPMAMYHSWGSQNAWLRQIHGQQPALLHRATAARARPRRRRLGPGRPAATAASRRRSD